MSRPAPATTFATLRGVGASCVSLPRGHWPLLLDFLEDRFKSVSRKTWLGRMQMSKVLDESGLPLAPDTPYFAPGRIFYYRELPAEEPIPYSEEILYRDEHLVVVDKPHFLPVMPSGRYLQETVLVRLKNKLGLNDLVPIHRIDRDTAGLVLFSIQPRTRGLYQALFRLRNVHKTYEAIAPWRADLQLPLTRSSRIEEAQHFMLQQEVAGEPNAETRIDVLEVQGQVARYKLEPVTGKRHQLRVHMAALGLPILGDGLYPTLTPEGQIDHAHPLQLLAKSLHFADPVSGQERFFQSNQVLQWKQHQKNSRFVDPD